MYKDYVAPVQNTQFLVEQGFPPGPEFTLYRFQTDCGNHIAPCPGCNKIERMGQAVRQSHPSRTKVETSWISTSFTPHVFK